MGVTAPSRGLGSGARLLWLGGGSIALALVLLVAARLASSATGLYLGSLALAAVGILLVLGALTWYVVGPAIGHAPRPGSTGSHRVVIATTLVALLLSNLVPLPLLVYLLVSRSGGRLDAESIPATLASVLNSPAGFLPVVLIQEFAFVSLSYFGLARSGEVSVSTWGLTRDGLGRRIAYGLAAGVGLFGLSALTVLALQQVGIQQTQSKEFAWTRSLPAPQFLLVALAGAVAAPFAEEIFFRGFVFRSYALRYGPLLAAVLSAALFALLHLNLEAIGPILVMGLALAWVYHRSGSLIPGIVAHGFNNGLALGLFYVFGA